MTDCSLNYKFNTWKFQAQTWPGENILCTDIVSDIQNHFCTQHVLPMLCQKKRASDKDLPDWPVQIDWNSRFCKLVESWGERRIWPENRFSWTSKLTVRSGLIFVLFLYFFLRMSLSDLQRSLFCLGLLVYWIFSLVYLWPFTTQKATEHRFLSELSKHLVKPGLMVDPVCNSILKCCFRYYVIMFA